MIRQTTVLALSALLAATVWTPTASAGGDWVFGGAFRIGGVSFDIGYHSDHHDRYYYRTRLELGRHYYGRSHRHKGCYYRDGHYFHGRSCPLIHAYFRDHGFYADAVFSRFAPRRHGRYYERGFRDYRGYRSYGHRDGYDGYSRRHGRHDDHRYRRDSRHPGRHYGKHHRGHGRHHPRGHHRGHHRGHRHDRHCGHH